MSTTGGTEQGTVLLLDEPDVIRRKFKSAVTDSGREVRRGDGQAGHHEPDRRSCRSRPARRPRRSRRSSTARATDSSRRRSARRWSRCSQPIQERYQRAPRGRAGAARLLAIGAEKAREAVGADARGDVRAHGLCASGENGRFARGPASLSTSLTAGGRVPRPPCRSQRRHHTCIGSAGSPDRLPQSRDTSRPHHRRRARAVRGRRGVALRRRLADGGLRRSPASRSAGSPG